MRQKISYIAGFKRHFGGITGIFWKIKCNSRPSIIWNFGIVISIFSGGRTARIWCQLLVASESNIKQSPQRSKKSSGLNILIRYGGISLFWWPDGYNLELVSCRFRSQHQAEDGAVANQKHPPIFTGILFWQSLSNFLPDKSQFQTRAIANL